MPEQFGIRPAIDQSGTGNKVADRADCAQVIGNKNTSSRSMRPWLFPWLLMRQFSIPFQEMVTQLDRPDTAARMREHSPAGRVPILKVDGQALPGLRRGVVFVAGGASLDGGSR
jgi:glutathione S-transferase